MVSLFVKKKENQMGRNDISTSKGKYNSFLLKKVKIPLPIRSEGASPYNLSINPLKNQSISNEKKMPKTKIPFCIKQKSTNLMGMHMFKSTFN